VKPVQYLARVAGLLGEFMPEFLQLLDSLFHREYGAVEDLVQVIPGVHPSFFEQGFVQRLPAHYFGDRAVIFFRHVDLPWIDP